MKLVAILLLQHAQMIRITIQNIQIISMSKISFFHVWHSLFSRYQRQVCQNVSCHISPAACQTVPQPFRPDLLCFLQFVVYFQKSCIYIK